MKLPDSLRLGARTVRLQVTRKLPRGELGQFRALPDGTHACEVRDGLDTYETASTLLHEVLHACSDLAGAGLKERQVLALEQMLGSAIGQNPAFFRALIKDLTPGDDHA